MSNSKPSRDQLRELCDELYEKLRNNLGDESIVDYLAIADEIERDQLIRAIFWRALHEKEWLLAEKVIGLGYQITPDDASDPGPLHDSMQILGERLDVFEFLIRCGAQIERRDLNNSNATPLIAATGYAFQELVRILLECGAFVDATTKVDDDESSLMIASRTRNDAIIKLLLHYDASEEMTNRWGKSAKNIAKESS